MPYVKVNKESVTPTGVLRHTPSLGILPAGFITTSRDGDRYMYALKVFNGDVGIIRRDPSDPENRLYAGFPTGGTSRILPDT